MRTLARVTCSLVLSTALASPATAYAWQPASDPAAGLTDAEKIERAKQLFGEGQAAVDAGQFEDAVLKFEQAYYYFAPNLHVFNFNIGNAAFESKDCIKAKAAFQRFLDLVPEHPERPTAQEKLMEIERTGCADQQAAAAQAAQQQQQQQQQQQTATPGEKDNEDAPILSSRRDERTRAIEEEREEEGKKHAPGLLVGGAVLTGLGVATLAGGAVSLVLANKKAKTLADSASPGPIGFPTGDYSSDDLFDLDRTKLPANNTATVALFIGGGAITAAGVALLVVHGIKKKKSKAAANLRPHLVGIGASVTRTTASAGASVRF